MNNDLIDRYWVWFGLTWKSIWKFLQSKYGTNSIYINKFSYMFDSGVAVEDCTTGNARHSWDRKIGKWDLMDYTLTEGKFGFVCRWLHKGRSNVKDSPHSYRVNTVQCMYAISFLGKTDTNIPGISR